MSPITEENPGPMAIWYNHREPSPGKPMFEQSGEEPALGFMLTCFLISTIKQYKHNYSDKTEFWKQPKPCYNLCGSFIQGQLI